MAGKLNKQGTKYSDGTLFINGILAADFVEFYLDAEPTVEELNLIGDRTPNTRIHRMKYTGSLTALRGNQVLVDTLDKFAFDGETVEFDIKGTLDDPHADYNDKKKVTAMGCVITSAIRLIHLDANANASLTNTASFNAKKVVYE